MFRTFVLLTLACVCAAPVALAQGAKPKNEKAAEAEKPDVLVVDINGELQLTSARGLKEFKKKLAKEYKEAVKEHVAAKKEAKKAKEKFTEPKPKKPKLKVMSKQALTEEQAEALMVQIIEERRKAEEKKNKKKAKK